MEQDIARSNEIPGWEGVDDLMRIKYGLHFFFFN
jgi:hypothetical protein